jgi:hypothetical protein
VHLYVIVCGQFVKVGISRDVRQRVHDLATANAEPIVVESTFSVPPDKARAIEAKVHAALAEYKARKRSEWFKVDVAEAVRVAAEIVWCQPELEPWQQHIVEQFGMPHLVPGESKRDRDMAFCAQVLN